MFLDRQKRRISYFIFTSGTPKILETYTTVFYRYAFISAFALFILLCPRPSLNAARARGNPSILLSFNKCLVNLTLLIRYMYTHAFSTVRPLCFVRLRDTFETTRTSDVGARTTVLPFFGGSALKDGKARHNRVFGGATTKAQKAHVAMGWEPAYEEAFHCVLVVCTRTHTHNTHIIICTHLFFIEHPTPNTQKKKGKTCVTLHFINRARARVQNRGSHTGSTRRRRFLRRVARERRYGSIRLFSRAVVVVGCVPRSSARK